MQQGANGSSICCTVKAERLVLRMILWEEAGSPLKQQTIYFSGKHGFKLNDFSWIFFLL